MTTTETGPSNNVLEMPPSQHIDQPRFVDRRDDRQAEIAQRAYEIFESRGRIDGADLDDWFEAEREFNGD